MKRLLRILALLVVVAGIALWLWGGQNKGWTKTTRPVEEIDPVTELTKIKYQKEFQPGVDFLGMMALVGAGLFGSSFLFRKT